jgi:hypothetical protein
MGVMIVHQNVFGCFRVLRVVFSMMALSPSFVVSFVASFVDAKSSS